MAAAGGIVSHAHGADSEIGALRTVLVHRPGLELSRLTPRTGRRLLLRTLPWVAGAQREHDVLAQALRDCGAEVLYLTALLQDALEYQAARAEAIRSALACAPLGESLRAQVAARLDELSPEDLAQALIAGLTAEELPGGHGLGYQMLGRTDFVLDPLPNLVFTRDSSFWIGDRVAVSSLAAPGRRREAALLRVIYGHHPRFRGIKALYGPECEPLDGGDVLLLAPSVLAIGVGQRTTAAAAERLARQALDAGLAHTVLAIPVDQAGGGGYLDTLCTVIDAGVVLMHPATAFTLTAHTVAAGEGQIALRVSRPQPFLEAAASALGIDRLQVIETGLDPGAGRRGQWDDGGNALAVAPGLAVCHERNTETIARLEAAGVAVIRVPGSELGSSRGGPRCMSCPAGRDPAPEGPRETGDPGEMGQAGGMGRPGEMGRPGGARGGREVTRMGRAVVAAPETQEPLSLTRVPVTAVPLTPVPLAPAGRSARTASPPAEGQAGQLALAA
jgi:arginine deiminase